MPVLISKRPLAVSKITRDEVTKGLKDGSLRRAGLSCPGAYVRSDVQPQPIPEPVPPPKPEPVKEPEPVVSQRQTYATRDMLSEPGKRPLLRPRKPKSDETESA